MVLKEDVDTVMATAVLVVARVLIVGVFDRSKVWGFLCPKYAPYVGVHAF